MCANVSGYLTARMQIRRSFRLVGHQVDGAERVTGAALLSSDMFGAYVYVTPARIFVCVALFHM